MLLNVPLRRVAALDGDERAMVRAQGLGGADAFSFDLVRTGDRSTLTTGSTGFTLR